MANPVSMEEAVQQQLGADEEFEDDPDRTDASPSDETDLGDTNNKGSIND